MLRRSVHRPLHRLLPTRLVALSACGAAVLACGAPSDDDAETLPEFGGFVVPGAAPSGAPGGAAPAGAAPGAPPPAGTASGAAPEAVGSGSSVPLGPGAGAGGAAGSAAPSAGAPGDGAGGSAMPAAPGGGGAPPAPAEATPPADAPPAPAGGDAPPGEVAPPPPASTVGGCVTGEGFFCESFDAAPLGALQGALNGLRPERSVSIVEEAGRGRVLQVQAGATYGNKAGVFLDLDPANANHHGRAFIRVAEFPSAGGDHWVVVEATSSAGGDSVRPAGGQFSRWAPGADGPSAGDWTDWQQSNAATTPGAWECVEWQLDTTNGGNDVLLWVNGTAITPLDRGNFRIPAIDELWFGWVVYQNAQPPMYDVRFDDIVLATERIGCD